MCSNFTEMTFLSENNFFDHWLFILGCVCVCVCVLPCSLEKHGGTRCFAALVIFAMQNEKVEY